jgi:hypothetical protein
MSKEKELDYFIDRGNWSKGIGWYKSHFTTDAPLLGESSPNYTSYPLVKGVAKRMHSFLPDAKLIYIVRDPVERIISQYIHYCTSGFENRSFEESLMQLDTNNRYIIRSQYYMQLSQFLKYYPKSDIIIITAEELYRERIETLNKIFRFLNVEEGFYSDEFWIIKHSSKEKGRKNLVGLFFKSLSETGLAKLFSTDIRMGVGRLIYPPFSKRIEKPHLTANLKAKIQAYLREDISQFRTISGRRYSDWSL